MKRLLISAAVAVVLAATLITFSYSSTPKTTEAFPGSDNPQIAAKWCFTPGLGGMTITWQTYNNGSQWVNISHNNNGWIWGTYVLEGPLPSGMNSFTPYYAINDNAPLYIMITTVTADGFKHYSNMLVTTLNACQNQPPVSCNDNDWRPGCAPPSWVNCGITTFSTNNLQGCVWVTEGENAEYDEGDRVVICYWVNRSTPIRVETEGPTGIVVNLTGFDDGRGDCIIGTAGQDGERTTRLYGSNNVLLDTTHWEVID